MPQHLQNRSRFAAADALLLDREGRELLVVCVAGRFVLPPAGRATTEPLRVSEEQPPPPRVGGESEPGNPVGCGLYGSAREAVDKPLPDVEDMEQLLESPTQRVAPVGFGPVARHWEPRRRYAGTYDAQWKERRAPLWPRDFDERFFQAAAPGLNIAGGLKGGEEVVLEGLSPGGRREFLLPRWRLGLESRFSQRVVRRELVLDGVHLEQDDGAVVAAGAMALAHRAHGGAGGNRAGRVPGGGEGEVEAAAAASGAGAARGGTGGALGRGCAEEGAGGGGRAGEVGVGGRLLAWRASRPLPRAGSGQGSAAQRPGPVGAGGWGRLAE